MSDQTIEERVLALEIKQELLERQVANLTEALTSLATKSEGVK
jgi:uncharacterized coiled-coil protein SlyX